MKTKYARKITTKDFLRIVDLASRRVKDNGLRHYAPEDQQIFRKLESLKLAKVDALL